MIVYFLRHGEADWPGWKGSDDDRPLTKRGKKEMRQVAKFLRRLKLKPEVILTSPLPRASQTAEIAADKLGVEFAVEPRLGGRFNRARFEEIIEERSVETLMIVGHEPAFSNLIAELTGARVRVAKSGVASLDIPRNAARARLLWLIPPRMANAVK